MSCMHYNIQDYACISTHHSTQTLSCKHFILQIPWLLVSMTVILHVIKRTCMHDQSNYTLSMLHAHIRFLFGRGWFSFSDRPVLKADVELLLQFPLMVEHVVLMTLSAWVFLINSSALGFSLTLPLCLCCPKKFSNGS